VGQIFAKTLYHYHIWIEIILYVPYKIPLFMPTSWIIILLSYWILTQIRVSNSPVCNIDGHVSCAPSWKLKFKGKDAQSEASPTLVATSPLCGSFHCYKWGSDHLSHGSITITSCVEKMLVPNHRLYYLSSVFMHSLHKVHKINA